MSTTPNMLLTLPNVGTTVGPAWANQLNTAFTQVDAHTHVVGANSGVPITSAALSIDAGVAFNNNPLTSASFVSLQDQAASLATAGSIYNNGGNLYFTDGSGTAIPITAAGGVAGSPGSIGYLSAPASANYGGGTFIWQSNTSTAATMDCGPILLRTAVASSNAVILTPASATTVR